VTRDGRVTNRYQRGRIRPWPSKLFGFTFAIGRGAPFRHTVEDGARVLVDRWRRHGLRKRPSAGLHRATELQYAGKCSERLLQDAHTVGIGPNDPRRATPQRFALVKRAPRTCSTRREVRPCHALFNTRRFAKAKLVGNASQAKYDKAPMPQPIGRFQQQSKQLAGQPNQSEADASLGRQKDGWTPRFGLFPGSVRSGKISPGESYLQSYRSV